MDALSRAKGMAQLGFGFHRVQVPGIGHAAFSLRAWGSRLEEFDHL